MNPADWVVLLARMIGTNHIQRIELSHKNLVMIKHSKELEGKDISRWLTER